MYSPSEPIGDARTPPYSNPDQMTASVSSHRTKPPKTSRKIANTFPVTMSQARSSYAYNPDLPIRKWHQKTLNPTISLQNAPPASHGTPAPTKEDGEFGRAGFAVRAWVPVDEDEDVPVEELVQEDEVDWWEKPGAPVKGEAVPVVPVVVPDAPTVVEEQMDVFTDVFTDGVVNGNGEDVMHIDAPAEVEKVEVTNTLELPTILSPPAPIPTHTPVSVASPAVPPVESPHEPPPQSIPQEDTEMTEAPLSPVHLTNVPSPVPSPVHSPKSAPAAADPQKSPSLPPATIAEILGEPARSPPADPVAQAQEVAGGFTLESPREHAQHLGDPGNLSGVGGGIAGEGIVGGGDEDYGPSVEEGRVGAEGGTVEEQRILEQSVEDLDTEVVHAAQDSV
jgi:hypothetical protein